jgi:ADP-ribose pyrophosphatase
VGEVRVKTDASAKTDKLVDAEAALTESTMSSQTVFQGHFLHVKRDLVRLPDGGQATREYVVHPGAVMVVPVLDDRHVVMERQYRHPLGRVLLEFPAGKIDAGEPPFECGRRELQEETGYRAREWARAGILHNAIAYSTEGIEVWFARGLTAGPNRLDVGEFLEVVTVSDEALEMGVRDGTITDAKTMIGLQYLQQWRAGRWPLQWRMA